MTFYRINAENIGRLDIGKAAEEMSSAGVDVIAWGRDEIFEGHAVWIVSAADLGEQLRDIVWRYNGGAWCQQVEISEEEIEEYC